MLAAVVVNVLNLVLLSVYDAGDGDFRVYRAAGDLLLHGGDLYQAQVVPGLWFTYPPVAAVLFVPLVLVSSQVWVLVSVAALGLALCQLRVPVWLALVLAPAMTWLEPVRSTLGFGQVNLVLLALVALDLLPRHTPWPRGLLLGFAAAIKLTPLVFLLYLLVRRDRRAIVTTLCSFAASTAVGLLAAPVSSWRYWTNELWHTDHIGALSFPRNQSLRGLVARLDLGTWPWLFACAAVLALAWVGVRHFVHTGRSQHAVVLTAFAGLLLSPVSWSHHWVWIAPALVVFATSGGVWRWLAVLELGLTTLGQFGPRGEGYICFGVLVLVVSACCSAPGWAAARSACPRRPPSRSAVAARRASSSAAAATAPARPAWAARPPSAARSRT
ncbi:alpha-1,2-mannosyltransferase [Kutzneria viridogrisea]|uniref:Alpha-1,2-mannosyltransferase n=1 Tax=Kutzneria viridogrisea TaxID=47990 RepID=A0ABR6B800_9PSEU|nr:alpha-1,2-mannosyltransferase [Kutzneria viridogrisea]